MTKFFREKLSFPSIRPLIIIIAFFLGPCYSASPACENGTAFTYKHISECKVNEFYDFHYFRCSPCSRSNPYVISTPDRLHCQCQQPAVMAALYDSNLAGPVCEHEGQEFEQEANRSLTNPTTCKFRFITEIKDRRAQDSRKHLRILSYNPIPESDCNECDMQLNYRHEDYCIEATLMKPYLKYNSYMPTLGGHYGDLKYVVFFCLAVRNATACNHLANLCVLSFYSIEKNSPCSLFRWAQEASESAMRYASMDDETYRNLRPFLFYKKGKATESLLLEPLVYVKCGKGDNPKMKASNNIKQLRLFSMTYGLDGSLRRGGDFDLNHVNLCNLFANHFDEGVPFAKVGSVQAQCHLTLENLIDLSNILANNNFISLFYNHTNQLQPVPILIEDLTVDNQKENPKSWQLVKRFQLIEAHGMYGPNRRLPLFESQRKTALYRSIRYVEHFWLHYKIFDNNQIGMPLVRLRFGHLILGVESQLATVYPFKLEVTYERVDESDNRSLIISDIVLPFLLCVALGHAGLHAYNWKKRQSPANDPSVDCCDLASFSDFFKQLLSNVATALLIFIGLHVTVNSLAYLMQKHVNITLPIEKNMDSLYIVIYTAFTLKLVYFVWHFWSAAQFNLFLIDWERPKYADNPHMTLKSALDTSSVCSSVRTYSTDNNVSTWRVLFIANEWVRLSIKEKTSLAVRILSVLIIFKLLDSEKFTRGDVTLKLFIIIVVYSLIYAIQVVIGLVRSKLPDAPIKKFIDLCSLSNVSVLIFVDSSFGFYIHGRSPHGFSDTDMASLAMQLQRESQNMYLRRGLLNDSDHQTYIVIPPMNMREYLGKIMMPLQNCRNASQVHYQNGVTNDDKNVDKKTAVINTVNRLFCAFIDHAIKDMDYIIKEKTFLERICNCEFDKYITENKGTFYIDNECQFSTLFLYGNSLDIFIMECLMLILIYVITLSLAEAVFGVYVGHMLFKCLYRHLVLQNVAAKCIIDKRFLT